jgi:hypothetical protein
MENNISPAPAARISPANSGGEKNSTDTRLVKTVKPQPVAKKSPAPPELDVAERDEKHQLDELA